jgi:hypothetical protein
MTALGRSHLDRPSYGLWSLWEMLKFEAEAFYRVTSGLSGLKATLDAHKEN